MGRKGKFYEHIGSVGAGRGGDYVDDDEGDDDGSTGGDLDDSVAATSVETESVGEGESVGQLENVADQADVTPSLSIDPEPIVDVEESGDVGDDEPPTRSRHTYKNAKGNRSTSQTATSRRRG